MSRICDICEKTYQKGSLVPRGIGRRVTNRAIKRQQPNIRRKKIEVNGTPMTLNICSSCLKRMNYEAKQETAQSATEV